MAKDGINVILAVILLSVILFAGVLCTGNIILKILFLISLLLVAFTIYFFRDPDRNTPQEKNTIISPADGKVILIEDVKENDFFKDEVIMISVFMSVFNVHVNRIPLTGEVTYFNYKKGAFLQAYKDDASYENEQTIIGIENDGFKILFKQIAGIVARRIVCNIRQGWKVKQGERFGMIKFGSRLDIFLPKSVEIKVKLNDKVKAGETIIGSYN